MMNLRPRLKNGVPGKSKVKYGAFILLIVILLFSGLQRKSNVTKLCPPGQATCSLYGFACTSPRLNEGGVQFTISSNLLTEIHGLVVEIPGCGNRTFESVRVGELLTLLFEAGECTNLRGEWSSEIYANWQSSGNTGDVFRTPFKAGKIEICEPEIPKEPRDIVQNEPDTCGNGECEDYEFLLTCAKDCDGLERHTYGFCRRASWDGVSSVNLVGTETLLEPSVMLGPDLQPLPDCDNTGTSNCFYCYNLTEVHDPIFEIHLSGGAGLFPLCSNLVLKYFIDGKEQECHDNKGEYLGRTGFYPYDKKRYEKIAD